MGVITITAGGNINYELLKDYHFSAKAIHEHRISKSLPLITDYEFDLDIHAENLEEGKQIYGDYVKKLDGLKVLEHLPNINFITQHLKQFEGNYINHDNHLDKEAQNDISVLITLLKLQEQSNDLIIEIKHKLFGKDFDDYIELNQKNLIGCALEGLIKEQIKVINIKSQHYSFYIKEKITTIDLALLPSVQNLHNEVISITDKNFRSQFLFTVCNTLISYLSAHTSLNPANAILTNDMARVVYDTCKINDLIQIEHLVDLDKVNYIRAVIKNHLNTIPMNGNAIDPL